MVELKTSYERLDGQFLRMTYGLLLLPGSTD
jgi:hypothetical protein